MKDFECKEFYTIEDLLLIIRRLRAPGGCPWDREQTHESIKKNFIEETYEVIEAIHKQDTALLQEELGDVLMQVVFHAQMEEERGTFTFADVANGVCQKLVERHPHVFGDTEVGGAQDVLRNWDDIKRKSKAQKTYTQSMQAVPRELPALMRADKIQQKAKKAGFDWPDVTGALKKVREETTELEDAVEKQDAANIQEELGDVLFSVVNVSRFLSLDAEEALTAATDKFMNRFAAVERLACDRGISMKEASLEELDALWDEAKQLRSQ